MRSRNMHFGALVGFASLALVSSNAAAGPSGYAFPFKASELEAGEYFQTDTHVAGIQGDGKDIIIQRRLVEDPKLTFGKPPMPLKWTMFKTMPPQISDVNAYLDYGRPFYAMEDGVVVGCWRNAPNNTPGNPGTANPKYAAGFIAGGGNHLWIRQKDGVYALYGHAMPGSIPSAICPHDAKFFDSKAGPSPGNPDIDPHVAVTNGAHIHKGELLGRVGFAGATLYIPHLHVHMEKNGNPWPMVFEKVSVTRFNPSSTTVSWVDISQHALPDGPILVWPDDGTADKCTGVALNCLPGRHP